MVTIQSPDGHDGFLLEFDQINKHLLEFIGENLSEIAEKEVCDIQNIKGLENDKQYDGKEIKATKNSLFGEAEVDDMMKW